MKLFKKLKSRKGQSLAEFAVTTAMMATLEPLISVFMGFMILTLALSIFLPIWDMYEAMSAS